MENNAIKILKSDLTLENLFYLENYEIGFRFF